MNYCLLKDVWGTDFGCEITDQKYSIHDKSNLKLEQTQKINRQQKDELNKIKQQTLKTEQEQKKLSEKQTKTAEEQKLKEQQLLQKETQLNKLEQKLTKKQKELYKKNKQILSDKIDLENKLRQYVDHLFQKQNKKTQTSKITGGNNTNLHNLLNNPQDIIKYLFLIYFICFIFKKIFKTN